MEVEGYLVVLDTGDIKQSHTDTRPQLCYQDIRNVLVLVRGKGAAFEHRIVLLPCRFLFSCPSRDIKILVLLRQSDKMSKVLELLNYHQCWSGV